MKWLILGALLGLLILFPPLLTAVAAAVAWLLAKPLLVGLGLGLVARPHLTHRRWAR
ncbi:hypothetical protein ACIRVK_13575 [Streptomyces sp. NPDC101152]|uniref:hypothetical protein n=1 Tax=Streptomyces sp. NPDC101152 TaxID=3366116 RepID=UPI0037F9DC5F